MLRARPLAIGGVMAMVFFGGYGAWTFNYAVLTQSGRGEPAWLSGTVLVPFCVAFLLASLQYHRITARLGGPGTMLVGALLQGIGLVGVGLVSVVSDAGYWVIGNGAATVDGKAASNQLVTIIDSGTTLVAIPPDDADTFYQAIQGAQALEEGFYTFPCDATPQVALTWGGKSWSISADE